MPILRPVAPADIPAITAIYRHEVTYGTASWEYTPPDADEMRRRVDALLAGGYPYLVAEIDGRLAGYSYASSYRPRPGYRFVVEDSIYVASDFRRRGVARLLLSALIDEAARRGFRQMIAVIGDSANHSSISLHSSLGFRHTATFAGIGFKHGRWLDSVQMQRALGEGSTTSPT